MPALEYLEGITHFEDTLLSLPLHHIRLVVDQFTFPLSVETPVPSLLSLAIEGTPKDGLVQYLDKFPDWFGGGVFPNLQELHVWHLDEMIHLPASFASFTALTELSLFEVGYNNRGEYQRETYKATSILDPSILRMTTLCRLNIIDCDFKTLPPFFMPSLTFLRISSCEHLYELPELSVTALPQLAVLELHHLATIRTLPDSLGELTALTRLHISRCLLQSMPMSMHALTALRELTIDSFWMAPGYCSLLRDVAMSLKGLHSLRKLCLSGPQSSCDEDLIFIGQSLKAWPPPFLDLNDNKFPILGFRVNPQGTYMAHYRDSYAEPGREKACWEPCAPSPFDLKRFWRALGLPVEAAHWDDGTIMEHWRTVQRKIEAFACIQHPRLYEGTLPDIPAENIAVIGHLVADWQRAHLRAQQQERMALRGQALSLQNATRLAEMRQNEHVLLLECQGLSPENTAAEHAASMAAFVQRRELNRQQCTVDGREYNDTAWARALDDLESEQEYEVYNNAYMTRVRREERARMLTRMQELEPP